VQAKSNQRCFATREQWRRWLAANHATAKEMWLMIHKKHTGKAGLTYIDALEEALCFGWIDDRKHTIRFCPRRKNSIWSQQNKKRVARLIEEGRMTPAGQAKIDEVKANGEWDKAAVREDITVVPAELTEALAGNEKARLSFERLAPSYRRQFIYWVALAKRPETRRRRIKETIDLLVRNKKLGMK